MSCFDLHSSFGKLLTFLPDAFCNEVQQKKLEKFQIFIPPALTRLFCFESPLHSEKNWIDTIFYMNLLDGSLASINKFFSENRNDTTHLSIWKDFYELLNESRKDNFFAEHNLTKMFFEFDVGSSIAWPPKPSVFFSVTKNHRFEEIYRKLFEILKKTDFPFSSTLSKVVKACAHRSLEIFQVGLMLSRDVKGVRVCIRATELKEEVVDDFLRSIDYPIDRSGFLDLLKRVTPYFSYFALHLDIAEVVSPKLGLECYIKQGSFSECKTNWENGFNFLVSEKFTTQEKRRAAISWLGGFKEELSEGWASYRQFLRTINHIKLIYAPGREIEAKVYLRVYQQ